MLTFIHIGKTGGSTIQSLLNLRQYHLQRNYNYNNTFIIWVRNPIARFVSAFNMSYVNINFKKYVKNAKMIGYKSVLVKKRINRFITKKNDYIYSPTYDELVNFFQTANNLAEALSSKNKKLKNSSSVHLVGKLSHHVS